MPKNFRIVLVLISAIVSFFAFSSLVYAGNPPDATNSSLSATEVPADGATQSVITITLNDSSGSAIVGDTIQLSNGTDATINISPTSLVTDSSGIATFSATSTTAGTDPIDVTDTTTSTTLTALGNIIFDPVATPTSSPTPTDTPTPAPSSGSSSSSSTNNTTCTNTPPASAPNLYQISSANGSATLYFAPPVSGFDGFTISYGLDSNADSYNASFSQGSTGGAENYTINSLTPETRYYFKVRANNGCAPGPWSSILSVNSSGGTASTSLPVTGFSAVAYLGFPALLMMVSGFGMFVKFR